MASLPYDIEAAALSLTREERAELARRLIASLDEEDEIAQAWAAEAERRLEELRDGRATTDDADTVFANIERKLNS